MTNWIIEQAKKNPTAIALTFDQQQWTFEQLKDISQQYAEKLTTLNIKKFDRVAIYARSKPTIIFTMLGCMQLQCEMVLLNLRLTKAELAYQLEDAQAEAILVEDCLRKQLPESFSKQIKFSQIEAVKGTVVDIAQNWPKQQTMTIMYTSGTTGFPKGVRQTVGNHEASATGSLVQTGKVENDVWLCTMPLFHISGFSMICKMLLHGVQVALYETFNVERVVDALVNGTVTRMSVVAVTLAQILTELENRQQKVSPRFATMLAGGGPMPLTYLQRALACGIQISQTYGMTETSSQTATLASEDAFRKIGSAGKPLQSFLIQIEGAIKAGDIGEICIKGPHVTPGYIGKYASLASTKNGWLYSGDIGYLDEEGYLYVVDRRSDLIISGGENIYPAEIESVLAAFPGVTEVGVCGRDDEKWGQVPVAFIVVSTSIEESALLAHCEVHLARYKCPKEIHFVEQLPRNGSNKLMRRKLKELL